MANRVAFLLFVSACFLNGQELSASDGISFADVRACAKCVGDFADVIPIVNVGATGLQAVGLLPDEEREFRAKIEAQNREILSGISDLSKGVGRMEVSLGEIRSELAKVRQEVEEIPERTRGGDVYVDAYTLVKRIVRQKSPSPKDLVEFKTDLQNVLDKADAASTLSPADLHFFSACSLICVAARKCYEAEALTRKTAPLTDESEEFYANASITLEDLLDHSELTFDLLAKRRELKYRHAAEVRALISSTEQAGFNWSDDKSKCSVGIRLADKREVKHEGFRITLLKTTKKYETVYSRSGFSIGSKVAEPVQSAGDDRKRLLSVYKPIKFEDFTSLSTDAIVRQENAGTLKLVDIKASLGSKAQLSKAIEIYNDSAAKCRRLAFQVTLADGLTKWLSENRTVVKSLKDLRKS